MSLRTWGCLPGLQSDQTSVVSDRFAPLPEHPPLLAFGNGRSYGDSAMLSEGRLLQTRGLARMMHFDRATGVLRCEAGVLLDAVLQLVVPQGWFLPVTPGTRFVTVGGAIANDVHGKNHHVMGTFGCHVRGFELLRSDGLRAYCTPESHPGLFRATIGGLGLTGLITWAELQLRPINNAWMTVRQQRFVGLDAFAELDACLAPTHEYTVAWIDCLSRKQRGIYLAANHAATQTELPFWRDRSRRIPFTPPISPVNRLTLAAFNQLYYHKPLAAGPLLQHYQPYFYPLDGIQDWNRMYGRRGFYQYQCVLPEGNDLDGVRLLLDTIRRSGQGSFLAVLKRFGAVASPGLLSFPMPGLTLALDFPNRGRKTHELFASLDAIVREAGGRLYAAKDARGPVDLSVTGHLAWPQFETWCDPAFASDQLLRLRRTQPS